MLEALQNSFITLTLLEMVLYRIQFAEDLESLKIKETSQKHAWVRRLFMSVEVK